MSERGWRMTEREDLPNPRITMPQTELPQRDNVPVMAPRFRWRSLFLRGDR